MEKQPRLRGHKLYLDAAMSISSFETLCLEDDDSPSPLHSQDSDDEFDNDLKPDGKQVEFIF